ncbi:MAG: hypothetical protein JNL67_05780 [Planctomycetaceae bacterium]|nr:hypothetical protein [Planctomycetaceae bacterium]
MTCSATVLFSILVPLMSVEAQWPGGRSGLPASPREVGSLPVRDDDQLDTLQALQQSGQVRRLIDSSELGRIGLRNSDGTIVALAEVVQTIRQPNLGLYQTAQQMVHTLSARPEWIETIAETDDAFVISTEVRLLVKDPQDLAAISPEFRDSLSDRAEGHDRWEDLPAEEQQRLEAYFKQKLASTPADHPLSAAGQQGPAALFAAIQEGYGEFAVTETVAFAKAALPVQNGRIMHPSFEQGFMNLRQLNPRERQLPNVTPPPALNPEVFQWLDEQRESESAPARPARRDVTVASGEKEFQHNFLTGFSIGSGWSWERKWESWAGHFEIKLGAGYEFGIRFPMSIHGVASPTSIRRYGRTDDEHSLSTRLTLKTFDAGPAYYRIMQVPEPLVFDGQEFVMGARAYYRINLRAFGRNWINEGKEFGFDFGRDLTPPTAGQDVNFRLEIPARLTGTHFDFWALSGSAQFGLKVTMAGEASIQSALMIDRQRADHGAMSIKFGPAGKANMALMLPAVTLPAGEDKSHYRYGLRLSDPKFQIAASLTPSVRGQLRSHVPGFRKTYSTGWLDLNRFNVELGRATLRTHEGTRDHRDITVGIKEFERYKTSPTLPGTPRPQPDADSAITDLVPPPRRILPDKSPLPSPPALKPPIRKVLPGSSPLPNLRKN